MLPFDLRGADERRASLVNAFSVMFFLVTWIPGLQQPWAGIGLRLRRNRLNFDPDDECWVFSARTALESHCPPSSLLNFFTISRAALALG
jgi:hypothetical protein